MALLGNKKNDSSAPKVLDVDASLQGNLVFKDAVNLHINGNFEGRLETKGDLTKVYFADGLYGYVNRKGKLVWKQE